VNSQTYGTLVGVAFLMFFVSLGVIRRMRPQPVRQTRILVTFVAILLVVGLSIGGTAPHLLTQPLAIALAPVCLVLGVALGVVLVRTMSFWTDAATGELWMRGGAIFAIVLVGTILLRFAVRLALTGSAFDTTGRAAFERPTTASLISTDLLFITIGLWGARAVVLLLRARAHEAAQR
jgi:membrane protein CcdC involved in cytochrome C biogenesis